MKNIYNLKPDYVRDRFAYRGSVRFGNKMEDFLPGGPLSDSPACLIQQFDSIDEFKNRKIYSFSLIESIRAKEITKEINENYPSLHAFQNVNAIDVVKRGCSKGNGILEITKLISDETAGIGDSYNDLEMFKVVNQSFTFKTSPKDIQQQTRYTVSSVKMAIDILNKE